MRSFIAAIMTKLASAQVVAEGGGWLVKILLGVLAHFTYVSLAVILVLSGTMLPIPEDIPLVISGYMCNTDHSPIKFVNRDVDLDGDGIAETPEQVINEKLPKVHWMIVAGMLGVLLGDTIVFTIGRRGIESNNIVARHLRKVMHSKRREKVEKHFARHGNMTIFVGRFMPGFRSIIFAFAGLSKMPYWRFWLIDGLAAGVSVPLFIWLGYHFAEEFSLLLIKIDHIKHILFPCLAILFIGAFWIYIRRRRHNKAIEALKTPSTTQV